MIILTIRTDKPEAEIGLYDGTTQIAHETWQAHKQLSETIHTKILHLLRSKQLNWQSIDGIVCYKGPGSFTGLRIGLTVANTLSAELKIPIYGANASEWQISGIDQLLAGVNSEVVMPEYGAPVHITQQKK